MRSPPVAAVNVIMREVAYRFAGDYLMSLPMFFLCGEGLTGKVQADGRQQRGAEESFEKLRCACVLAAQLHFSFCSKGWTDGEVMPRSSFGVRARARSVCGQLRKHFVIAFPWFLWLGVPLVPFAA